ncbi:MAG: ABC transporter ATP-binding protein [Bacteroidetes bacterium]|nr:MAG: ABC transporter ATP-binding protein [Bacteroidota bacterium]
MEKETVIEVKNLTKAYGAFKAVNDISFEVYKGEIFGFLGANGAGKTTAIKMLTGIITSTSGDGSVAGYNINKQRDKLKENIGYMSQKFSLYEDLTLMENVEFYGGIYGLSKKQIIDKATLMLDRLHMNHIKETLISDIPLGWKQKIAFSVAIIHDPKIVFLDEPTSGVDPITRRQFWDLIYQAVEDGITVFVTTHYMDEAEYCDRISMMVDGEIHAIGSLQYLLNKYDSKTMDEVFIKIARG